MDLVIVCPRHPTPPPRGGEVTPYNGIYGRRGGSSRKSYLFQPSGKWNVMDFTCWSIWMCREICHFVGKKAQKDQQVHFKAVKKLRKRSGFVIYSWYVKDNAFTVVERDAKFYTWCVTGVSFINRRYTKGGTFLSKTVYKRVIKGSNLGVEPPCVPFLWHPPRRCELVTKPKERTSAWEA